MIETAEIVAERYQVTRQRQDEYALQSQQRTAAAQAAGRFDAEIAPLATVMKVADKATGAVSDKPITLKQDEGPRADTTLAGLSALKPVFADGQRVKAGSFITAGNASQLSDGASACVLMDAKLASQRNLKPLGIYRGIAVAGCDPDEMGIGPVFAVPKLLKAHGLKVDDIGLWELNEAFAVQVIYCRDRLGIDNDKLNVDGGAICGRPPLWHERLAPHRPRADRGQATRRALCRGDNVRRRRHGCGRTVRSRLNLKGVFAWPNRTPWRRSRPFAGRSRRRPRGSSEWSRSSLSGHLSRWMARRSRPLPGASAASLGSYSCTAEPPTRTGGASSPLSSPASGALSRRRSAAWGVRIGAPAYDFRQFVREAREAGREAGAYEAGPPVVVGHSFGGRIAVGSRMISATRSPRW